MRVAATMIDRIVGATATDDGCHVALRLRDCAGNDITLGLASAEMPCLIECAATALNEIERTLRLSMKERPHVPVTWWNLSPNYPDEGYALTLTFGAGASLGFVLSQHMAIAMLETLKAYVGNPATTCLPGFSD